MRSNGFRDIKFKFEKFAGIDTCEFSLGALSVMSGPNGAGKTYVVYAIYSLLKELRDLLRLPVTASGLRALVTEGIWSIDLNELVGSRDFSAVVSQSFKSNLPRYFSVSEDFFSDSTITIQLPSADLSVEAVDRQIQIRKGLYLVITKPSASTLCTFSLSGDRDFSAAVGVAGVRRLLQVTLTDLVFGHLWVRPFAITSERTGISLFWKELDINKNQIIEKLIEQKGRKFDPWDLIEDQTSRYAMPITDNIDVARDADNVAKLSSFISSDQDRYAYIKGCLDKIVGGKFKYNKDGISFEYGRGRARATIPIYVASSSTKSLFLLDLFINHVAEEGGLLVFDEPELNLHPANQRLMAQLIARLVSIGVNVLLTTHSDFLIREINNRVMLSRDMPGRDRIFTSGGIDPREVLVPGQVKGFLLSKERKLLGVPVDVHGIDMKSIDDSIVGASSLQGQILDLLASADEV